VKVGTLTVPVFCTVYVKSTPSYGCENPETLCRAKHTLRSLSPPWDAWPGEHAEEKEEEETGIDEEVPEVHMPFQTPGTLEASKQPEDAFQNSWGKSYRNALSASVDSSHPAPRVT
jgi:hypothetical protein